MSDNLTQFPSTPSSEHIPLTFQHFRVMALVSGKQEILDTVCPDKAYARRIASDVIKGGGIAYIYSLSEVLVDEGATLEVIEPEPWL